MSAFFVYCQCVSAGERYQLSAWLKTKLVFLFRRYPAR